jgi:hypothetical protein
LGFTLTSRPPSLPEPRQKTVCSLGDLSPRPRAEWLKLARKIEDALVGQDDLLDTADNEVADIGRTLI